MPSGGKVGIVGDQVVNGGAAGRPLFSVIIPAYNAEAHLEGAINSVMAESEPTREVIVIDDGSTDSTWRLACTFSRSVTAVRQFHRGVSQARNLGVSRSRGRFITFLDADDRWMPGKLQHDLSMFRQHPSVRAIGADCLMDSGAGPVKSRFAERGVAGPPQTEADWRTLFKRSLSLSLFATSSFALRRSYVEERSRLFDPKLRRGQDRLLELKLLATKSIAVSTEATVYVNRREDRRLQAVESVDWRERVLLALLADPTLPHWARRAANVALVERMPATAGIERRNKVRSVVQCAGRAVMGGRPDLGLRRIVDLLRRRHGKISHDVGYFGRRVRIGEVFGGEGAGSDVRERGTGVESARSSGGSSGVRAGQGSGRPG